MKTKFYLKVNQSGSVSTSKGKPNLDWDQVAILVNVELPDVLFQKPQITASINVGSENVTPFLIDAATVDNVKDAIQTATGLQVKITLEQPES